MSSGTNKPISEMKRVRTDGTHLSLDDRPFRVKGVTYGSFPFRLGGEPYPESDQLKQDLVDIRDAGLNTIRTYTLPPVELLDLAQELGLRVLVGLDYRDWRYEDDFGRSVTQRVRAAGLAAVDQAMERCAGRAEVLAVAVGNEVPGDVVRVHGIAGVEDVLNELVTAVHLADDGMLATYCNFPTTEYLNVRGQDLICMNVFLEEPDPFRKYLRHLQVVGSDKPLILTELGLASEVHGEDSQALALQWQLRMLEECGVAGATVFSWTDEWAVADEPVEGWGFGVTDAERRPKLALSVLKQWSKSTVRDLRSEWPRVSVVVCAYNAAKDIESCLSSLAASDYPNLEVLVCDDGSLDDTREIAGRFPFRLLTLPHGGLSRARNAGIETATGEIVAFLDSDAFCHPEWPYYLSLSLEENNVVATGGPNHPVPNANIVEQAVAQSPGAPMEVLVADDRAEHVPGCNMAYVKQALVDIGGFNPIYTAAGDDVDVCWKILEQGSEIGFSPATQVRHHRRDTVSGYLRQQRGYGRAEALLAPHHRHRFNRLGQARWSGFVYGGPRFLPRLLRPTIYHGWFGSAPYQPISRSRSDVVRDWTVALMPLLVIVMLAGLAMSWLSMWWLLPSAAALLSIGCLAIFVAAGTKVPRNAMAPMKLRGLVALFHLTQPLVRTWGRLTTPAPKVGPPALTWIGNRAEWLHDLERHLADCGNQVRFGGGHASWDIEVWRYSFLSWRVTTAVLWGWTPVAKVRPTVRVGLALVFVAVAGMIATSIGWGLPVGGTLLAFMVLEAFWVRRKLAQALSTTTRRDDA